MANSYQEFGADLGFPPSLLSTIHDLGYKTATPVQQEAIPLVLEGRDLLATAQTGTGKTAAFALPLISQMLNGKQKRPALIVAPTRELAEQIGAVLVQLTAKTPHLRVGVIIGGSSYSGQIRALRSRPAFVVGTPGRLLDQVELKHLQIENFGTLVIDEADRLLDMGFEPQMNALVKRLPADRQSLLFSATLPDSIIRLANSYLREPARVAIGTVSKPVDRITQQVIKTSSSSKDETLIREIDKIAGSLIVFTKTKWRTEKVAKLLSTAGHEVVRIHGDRSQRQRSTAIAEFRDGHARILVATDIAARGIDIPEIRYVVNYDLPLCPEDYIHRIGRTGRAGAEGHALAFVTPDEDRLWGRIHKLIYGHFPKDQRSDGHPQRSGGRPGGPPKRFNQRGPQNGQKNSQKSSHKNADRRHSGGKNDGSQQLAERSRPAGRHEEKSFGGHAKKNHNRRGDRPHGAPQSRRNSPSGRWA